MKRLYSEYSIRFDPPKESVGDILLFTAVVKVPKTNSEDHDVSAAIEAALDLLDKARVDRNYIGPWEVELIEEQYLMSVEE